MNRFTPLAALLLLGSALVLAACETTDPSNPGNNPGNGNEYNPVTAQFAIDVGHYNADGERILLEATDYTVTRNGSPAEIIDGMIQIPADPVGVGVPVQHEITVHYTDPNLGSMVHRPIVVTNDNGTARTCIDGYEQDVSCSVFGTSVPIDLNVDATGTWTCVVNNDPGHFLSGQFPVTMVKGHVANGIWNLPFEVTGCAIDDDDGQNNAFRATFESISSLLGSYDGYNVNCTR